MLALAAQTFWIGINHLNWYQSIECWRYQRSDCIWINWVLKKKHMCGHMCLCVALLENTSGHIFWKCILEIHSDIQICSYLYLHDKIVFIFSADTSQTNEVQRFSPGSCECESATSMTMAEEAVNCICPWKAKAGTSKLPAVRAIMTMKIHRPIGTWSNTILGRRQCSANRSVWLQDVQTNILFGFFPQH